MPKRVRLTEKVLRDAIPAEGRDYQIFDDDIRGFAVCVYRGGGRAFTFDYRFAGRQRRMTFARWPEWSVTAARDRAREFFPRKGLIVRDDLTNCRRDFDRRQETGLSETERCS